MNVKLIRSGFLVCRLMLLTAVSGFIMTITFATAAWAADFKSEIIYQVFTDRFFSGRNDNDDPAISKGLFDPEKKNWRAYWGGDLEGVRQKLDYINEMGASAIWISPTIDNVNKVVLDEKGNVQAPYHGYHGRDFKRIDEHFGDPENSWKDFDRLVSDMHQRRMKIIVDLPLNHSSEYNHGEFGAFWDDGEYKGDVENDKSKYFNHLPLIKDFNDRYQLQYGTIFYLGDFNQENEYIDRYLKSSSQKYLEHGADATRLDAAKHTNWGWQQTLANRLYSRQPHFVVAEWWLNDTKDPLYRDAAKFANVGGVSIFDFAFANAIRTVLGSQKETDFKLIDEVITQEYRDFDDANGMITFIDNHDMPRFLTLNDSKEHLHLALALLLTSRGTPAVYYGTEQYLHDDTKGGGDPWTRAWMPAFDRETPCYKLVKQLSSIRRSNPAFVYGHQKTVFVSKNSYVFERRFGDNVAVIAINKDMTNSAQIELSKPALPKGNYDDQLKGQLKGIHLVGEAKKIELPPASVSVWIKTVSPEKPLIGSVSPKVISRGDPVTIGGIGFGAERGSITIGTEAAEISSWSDNSITIAAPHLAKGKQKLSAVTRGGAISNIDEVTLVEAPLIPIRFVVKKAPLKNADEHLFLTGDNVTLGQWSTTFEKAAGPMLLSEDQSYILVVPMPASQHVNLKLFVMDKNGKVIKQESKSHSYHVPELGSWAHELSWQD